MHSNKWGLNKININEFSEVTTIMHHPFYPQLCKAFRTQANNHLRNIAPQKVKLTLCLEIKDLLRDKGLTDHTAKYLLGNKYHCSSLPANPGHPLQQRYMVLMSWVSPCDIKTQHVMVGVCCGFKHHVFLSRVEATCKSASYIFTVCVSECLYTMKIQSLKVSILLGRENPLLPEKNWYGSHQSWPKVKKK